MLLITDGRHGEQMFIWLRVLMSDSRACSYCHEFICKVTSLFCCNEILWKRRRQWRWNENPKWNSAQMLIFSCSVTSQKILLLIHWEVQNCKVCIPTSSVLPLELHVSLELSNLISEHRNDIMMLYHPASVTEVNVLLWGLYTNGSIMAVLAFFQSENVTSTILTN